MQTLGKNLWLWLWTTPLTVFDQVNFAGMMEYDGELHIPRNYLVPPPNIKNTSGEFLAHNGVSTFA